ncbi:hypothetical protein M3P21_22225 [Ruegeria sp. 2012CJ41-6]|uniref:Uncharacterized protein n=1 Tax=Ruegeria spongiae TaxID=2942209 RepID=A0ABT0Q9I6_9RHOB|nr:hypothetical protein [Ruegeria spongiae]MCL6286212.1 hypothetical protein [Ruegeria spongiae]
MSKHPEQLGFDALLETAAQDNTARVFEQETSHLPSDWTEAIAFHRRQIERHNDAMLANDFDAAMAIRNDAYLLARKLNGGAPGILAGEDAPGCVLARKVAAKDGYVPLWGQDGVFAVRAAGMAFNVEMNGMFGIGATAMPYLGFSVRAVDCTKPFLSETGYRSFLGVSVEPVLDMTVAGFVCRVVELHVANELKGKLLSVAVEYREQRS